MVLLMQVSKRLVKEIVYGIETAGIGVNGGAVIGSVYNRQWRNCFALKDVGALGGFAVYAISDATNKMLNICK